MLGLFILKLLNCTMQKKRTAQTLEYGNWFTASKNVFIKYFFNLKIKSIVKKN